MAADVRTPDREVGAASGYAQGFGLSDGTILTIAGTSDHGPAESVTR